MPSPTVDHYFALARVDAIKDETRHRIMGYPRGYPLETIRQTAPVPFQDEVWYQIPLDRESEGGFSGGPFFDENGKVVAMLSHSNGNMVSAVKVEVIGRFVDGDLPWAACRDYLSVASCIEHATTQAPGAGRSGRPGRAVSARRRDGGHLDEDRSCYDGPRRVDSYWHNIPSPSA